MIRGLYTAAAGMLANNQQSDTIDQNIENLKTPGYRQASEKLQAFPAMLVERMEPSSTEPVVMERTPIGSLGTGVQIESVMYQDGPGMLRETGNQTDVAITARGYFAVSTPDGERYTRSGHFLLDSAGGLRTPSGCPVLGQNGPVGPIPENFEIREDGTMINKEDNMEVDRLRLVDIPTEALQREGDTLLFSSSEGVVDIPAGEVRLKQGYVEESNVNLNAQIVKMLEVVRSYSANQKVVQTNDSLLQKAVNEIGKLA
ncbi:fagellar hook-basal body protein [Syntrophobotulus glycolicus DSM 8271]|uniref:Fagellar hook-basal body protein n=1 Tax=Syntrophobotulus glycolicus (strain DSM 8271 / FlGlyR) TaxID=645991 RepID=F0SZX5_SYNGF|nr:flagellar hook-basal body protein [Syntrophobotulus glycolicus]ADY54986.1 fagellar hook-basal body protein [Syntrophobotulus glycolicus DSM 8271]